MPSEYFSIAAWGSRIERLWTQLPSVVNLAWLNMTYKYIYIYTNCTIIILKQDYVQQGHGSKAPDTVSKMPLQLTGLMSHPALVIQNSHWASQVSEVAFGKRDELRVRDCLGQMFLLAPPKRCATCSTAFMHSLCSNNLCRSQSTNRMPALLCRGRCPLAGGPKNHKGPIAQQFQHNMAFG